MDNSGIDFGMIRDFLDWLIENGYGSDRKLADYLASKSIPKEWQLVDYGLLDGLLQRHFKAYDEEQED